MTRDVLELIEEEISEIKVNISRQLDIDSTVILDRFIQAGKFELEVIKLEGAWDNLTITLDGVCPLMFISHDLIQILKEQLINDEAWWWMRKGNQVRLRVEFHCNRKERKEKLKHLIEKNYKVVSLESPSYEAESFLFGGKEGLSITHSFFASDSQFISNWYRNMNGNLNETERAAIILYSFFRMFYYMGIDSFECWDIFEKVKSQRLGISIEDLKIEKAVQWIQMIKKLDWKKLRSICTTSDLELIEKYIEDCKLNGQKLLIAHEEGKLNRGIRGILATWILFTWNRLDLNFYNQARISTALAIAFNPDKKEG